MRRMKTFFRVIDPLYGNSPVTGEFPSQRPVTCSLYVFFDLCLNKRLSKQSRRRWFEMPWAHYGVIEMAAVFLYMMLAMCCTSERIHVAEIDCSVSRDMRSNLLSKDVPCWRLRRRSTTMRIQPMHSSGFVLHHCIYPHDSCPYLAAKTHGAPFTDMV